MLPRVKNTKVGKIDYRDFHFRGDVISHQYIRAYIKSDKLGQKEFFQRRKKAPLWSMSTVSGQLLVHKLHNVGLLYKYTVLELPPTFVRGGFSIIRYISVTSVLHHLLYTACRWFLVNPKLAVVFLQTVHLPWFTFLASWMTHSVWGFLSLNTIDILDWRVLYCGAVLSFASGILGFYSLDSISHPLLLGQ